MGVTPMGMVLVMTGGALGAAARYAMVDLIKPSAPGFPLGTLLVNLLGCALIGVLVGVMGVSPLSGKTSGNVWLFLATGVLGGFTTFSAFAIESTQLLKDGRAWAALSYVLLSTALGIALAMGAMVVTEKVVR